MIKFLGILENLRKEFRGNWNLRRYVRNFYKNILEKKLQKTEIWRERGKIFTNFLKKFENNTVNWSPVNVPWRLNKAFILTYLKNLSRANTKLPKFYSAMLKIDFHTNFRNDGKCANLFCILSTRWDAVYGTMRISQLVESRLLIKEKACWGKYRRWYNFFVYYRFLIGECFQISWIIVRKRG